MFSGLLGGFPGAELPGHMVNVCFRFQVRSKAKGLEPWGSSGGVLGRSLGAPLGEVFDQEGLGCEGLWSRRTCWSSACRFGSLQQWIWGSGLTGQ